MKLQHPLDIAYHYPSKQLYISDTYNDKLKCVDMKTGICSNYVVVDTDINNKDNTSNTAKFNEPQGLTIFENFLFVIDKNQSHIKRIDLTTGTIARVSINNSDRIC